MNRQVSLVFALAALALLGGVSPIQDHRDKVAAIRNDHLTWTPNCFVGMHVELSEVETRVLKVSPLCLLELLEALDDDDRFAAAHVILTFAYCDSYPVEFSAFNNLQATFDSEHRAYIRCTEKAAIKKHWAEFFRRR
jgi:hypothetical protein